MRVGAEKDNTVQRRRDAGQVVHGPEVRAEGDLGVMAPDDHEIRDLIACIVDSCVPTASITECAPSPLVSSLILATPSSPRSSTMSVAP